ncbi:MAG TPA: hypothetical protein VMI56_04945 [Reyranella sp.]|nr:hypothetical protein [Reyranella sp.]
MRRSLNASTAALIAAVSVSGAARAQEALPAVSGLNGKFSLESGVEGDSGKTTALGLASGSISTPLGHAFGLQLDGSALQAVDGFTGGGTAHLFWRDPAVGLLGPFATVEGTAEGRMGWYGGEAELYAGLVTLGAAAGYWDAAASVLRAQSGGFWNGHVSLYPMPDLALTAGVESMVGRVSAVGGLEYQPTLFRQHNMSFFVNAAAGDQSSYSVTAGIRFYFGADKTLIRRHREDDPVTLDLWGPGVWLVCDFYPAACGF